MILFEKFVKNTLLRVVFSTLFSVFHLVMKHCISCLIYYINTELAHVNSWLKANKLVVLNVSNTEFMIIGSRQRLQTQAEVSIRAHIEGKEIKRVDSSKFLGLTMDETLS